MDISTRVASFFYRHPAGYMVLAAIFLAIFTATGKSEIPILIIVFLRFIIPFVLLTLSKIHNIHRIIGNIKTTDLLSLIRTFFVVASQYTFFYCVKKTSLFDATTLLNTAPIFILIIYFFYNRSFSINKTLGVLCGFIGTLLILKPERTSLNIALIAGLGAGFCWAMSNFLQSKMLEKHSNEQCMFYYYFYGTIISFIILIFSQKISWLVRGLDFNNLLIILFFSIATISFQYFTGKAYKARSAFELSPFLYLTILFSWFIDLIIFNHVSSINSIIGSLLIFIGMIVSRRTNLQLLIIKKNKFEA